MIRIKLFNQLLAVTGDKLLAFNWVQTLNKVPEGGYIGTLIVNIYSRGSIRREDLRQMCEFAPHVFSGDSFKLASAGLFITPKVYLEWLRLDLEELYGK
jgi:hypothetical protein